MRLLPPLALLLIPAIQSTSALSDEPGRPFEVRLNADNHQVIALDTGKLRWTAKLNGRLDGVRPPHLVWDAARVYLSHDDGVTALDATTGKLLWHAGGPNRRLLLSKDLLVAVGWSPWRYGTDCWVTARSVNDGKTVFKTKVDVAPFDPVPLQEIAGLFLVQSGWGDAWLLDRKGQVRHRMAHQVLAGVRCDEDAVLITSTEVVRITADDQRRWTIPLEHRSFDAGDLVVLRGGDLVAFRYDDMANSGVDLVRFSPATGKVAWRSFCSCQPDVTHPYSHSATVAIEGDRLRVTDNGQASTIVEILDVKTGRQLTRSETHGR